VKKIAIVLATHNGEPWIAEQVNSLLQQEGVHIDIYASDDASSDRTPFLLLEFAKAHNNFKVVSFQHPAGSAAANFSRILCNINLEDYDYVSFSDQDDIWNLDKLHRAVVALAENKCEGYSAPVRVLSNGIVSGVLNQSPNVREFDYVFEGAGQGCTYVISRQLAMLYAELVSRNLDWSRGPYYHDWCVYALSRIYSYNWFFDTKPALLYRQHGHNDIGSKNSVGGITSRIRKISTGWYSDRIFHIYKLLLITSSDKAIVEHFSAKVFASKASVTGRLAFLKLLAFKSRRKLSDRLVLIVSELFGLISCSFTPIRDNSTGSTEDKYS
jgi:rhamnosyltransferase